MNVDGKTEHIATTICSKPPDLAPSDCHSSLGKTNPLCHDHKTCRVAEKSEEQLDYVAKNYTPGQSPAVLAAAVGRSYKAVSKKIWELGLAPKTS